MAKRIRLGASLYTPATHKDIELIANGKKHPHLKSMIFCTEDSIHESEVPQAIQNLEKHLVNFEPTDNMRFIRVRNPHILNMVLSLPGIEKIDGFVLPKITAENLMSYMSLLERRNFKVMITLETKETFDYNEMVKLRTLMLDERHAHQILALRIGGNDLLSILGVRRPRNMTIYDTPLGKVISDLVTIFRPYGFHLTSPVFEHTDLNDLLKEELKKDLSYGLIGKTAIHPDQIALIESMYKVYPDDVEAATSLLEEEAPAVFKMHGSMCELATHGEWARGIIERKDIYGLRV